MNVAMPTRAGRSILLALLFSWSFGCGPDGGDPMGPGDGGQPGELPPTLSDELVSNLFDWPAVPFGRGNAATIQIFRHTGDRAVDFSLLDLEGEEHRLSRLLGSAPVLLLPGSYTCPVYQARVPELNQLFAERLPDGRTFGQAVHFVHVYIVEAHPRLPDPTPYRSWTDGDLPDGGGEDHDTYAYSVVGQAHTYAERWANARRMRELVEGSQLMLLDDLVPHGLNNPVWCTYGTAPDAAYLIDRTGRIVESQLWADVGVLRERILEILGYGR